MWGGVECTVNRVGDVYRDQLRLTGHHDRIEDLDAVAALGIRRLRYPVLWERVAPDAPAACDWSWSDDRLDRIRAVGIAPIAGLLHHGSGPRYTSLIDPDFPSHLTDFAAAAVQRYPWIEDWTPINEPLTTARFSALYGHWYPHARDERTFYTALLNQIDATRGAMRAIRAINPAARLIQTEDLGETFSTPALAGVAAYLNRRRWLGWDLLCGLVDEHHPLWPDIARYGLADRLRRIHDDPSPPDVIGINHYVTSDRFLDDRPGAHRGPIPEAGYHDVCAARVLEPARSGPGQMLRAAWQRYEVPVAITESHLGCSREEQLRWLWQGWRQARALADEGVSVAGFTAWALFGGVDWNSLITRDDGHYEPGAFDVRGGRPRPTAISRLIGALAHGRDDGAADPVFASPGWWHRPARLEHPAYPGSPNLSAGPSSGRPILITGATGTLGRALARSCDQRGLAYLLTDRATLPIEDQRAAERCIEEHRPWRVINTAGWVRVDDAEYQVAECMRANADGAAALAAACNAHGVHFTTFSSDLVFGGDREAYVEKDSRAPLCVYGRSKAEAEDRVRQAHVGALIIRSAAFFSPHDEHNFAMAVERELRTGGRFLASDLYRMTPSYVPHLADATLDLAIDGEAGIWHLTNHDGVSWFEFAQLIACHLDLDPRQIVSADERALGWTARRPRSACLFTERGRQLPSLGTALREHAAARVGASFRTEADPLDQVRADRRRFAILRSPQPVTPA